MHKINKTQLIKSFISVIAIFLFNLPTIAALNIDYKNLLAEAPIIDLKLPNEIPSTDSAPKTPSEEPKVESTTLQEATPVPVFDTAGGDFTIKSSPASATLTPSPTTFTTKSGPAPPINHNDKLFGYLNCNQPTSGDQNIYFSSHGWR